MKNVNLFNRITRERDVNDTSRHKDRIEIARINTRSVHRSPQEHLCDILYKPDKNSPTFADYNPLKEKDFNEADKVIRKQRIERHKQIVLEKTVNHLQRDVKRWNIMAQQFDHGLDKITNRREILLNSWTHKGHGYNIITQQYDKSPQGTDLQQKDLQAVNRLNRRTRTLYDKCNATYDILTGIPRNSLRTNNENIQINQFRLT